MHLSQIAKKQSKILAAREKKRHILFKRAIIWLVVTFQLLRYLSETIMTTIKWREKVKKKKKNFELEFYLMLNNSSEVKAIEKYIKVKNNEIICHQETYTLKDKNKLLQIEAKWCYRRAWNFKINKDYWKKYNCRKTPR